VGDVFCRAYLHTVANKKQMTSVVEKIGFSAAQTNILNVLGKYLYQLFTTTIQLYISGLSTFV